ncbi:hypothetical protein B4110_3789 [Parageobacillus toebii]|uniref:Uncharacterized protein n=1 Tax=Parageobacillus toebii TaxID=153151 RepID=A0A150MPI9_9BACL|nr:hypothetical protein B4110_3789 [Parageobacillus toebii]
MLLPFIPKEQMLNGTALKQNTKKKAIGRNKILARNSNNIYEQFGL